MSITAQRPPSPKNEPPPRCPDLVSESSSLHPDTASAPPLSLPPVSLNRPVRWLPTAGWGAALILLNCFWIANSEMRTGVTEVTVSTIFMGALFLLFALVGINALVRRFWSRIAFSSPELLVLYAMLTLSSAAAGVGAIGFFTPFVGNVSWFADPNNNWQRFYPLLPSWFGPREPKALSGFYLGKSTLFTLAHLKAWALPCFLWGAFFFTVLYVSLCFTSIFRAQWVDAERLPFPTALLPVEMTRQDGSFFRNRLLWMGFGLPFAIQSLNSLNSLFPTVPAWHLNQLVDYHAYFSGKPWNGVDAVLVGVHPAGVGLTFIAPLDMSFSMWFFYLLKKALCVFGVARGWRDPDQGWDGDGSGQFPFTANLAWGGWVVLALSSYWMARGHLKGVYHRAVHGDPEGRDRGELMSSRAALGGLAFGLLAIFAFCWAMGAPFWVPVVYFTVYLLLMTVLCRVVAEVGPPSISLDWGAPQELLVSVMGTRAFTTPGLVNLASLSWFNMDYRAAPMPHQLVAAKIGGLGRIPLRPLMAVLLFALAVAIPAAMICDLEMYYRNGAATAKVNDWRISTASVPWELLDNWEKSPREPNFTAWTMAGVGALLQMGIIGLRSQLPGFMLHPAAFSLICTFSMDAFWVDFFLSWLLKLLLLRYGGMKAYRAALPFFLGLVLGDFTAGAGWSLVGTFLGLNLYRTFPT